MIGFDPNRKLTLYQKLFSITPE